ncbi:MAG: methyltransferase [Lachnospiraceae bacterium]|nr:methyltransferase [Lachnospiraceae bacterium]
MERIPFRREEMEVKGYTMNLGRGAYPLLNTPISPRENYLMLLRGEEPLWMPLARDTLSVTPAICKDNIARGFVFDTTGFDPNKDGGGPDMFGVEWEWVPQVRGSMVRPGHPKVPDITEWEDYIEFPDPDTWDWAGSAEINKALIEQNDLLRGATILNGLFERLISFVEMSEALVAMIDEDEQEAVHRLFDRLADFYPKIIRGYKEYYNIDILTFHDDWGSQRAPFFSLDTVREMLVPYLKRIVDATHELGVKFELHSCGKNEMLVPAMIEAGVDMWNGQPMNDKKMLVEKYGDEMIFGAYPTTITAESAPEEVRSTCKEFIDTFNNYRIYGGFSSAAMAVPNIREYLYEFSRIAKCGSAE